MTRRLRRAFLALALLAVPLQAHAGVEDRSIGVALPCTSPPCDFENAQEGKGMTRLRASQAWNKTVQVDFVAGTGTVEVYCRTSSAGGATPANAAKVKLATVSASGLPFEFTLGCSKVWLITTACTGCQVTAWVVGATPN